MKKSLPPSVSLKVKLQSNGFTLAAAAAYPDAMMNDFQIRAWSAFEQFGMFIAENNMTYRAPTRLVRHPDRVSAGLPPS
jgi:hypothetical protein